MKRYDQSYTCLNKVLLLKLLQIQLQYTAAWVNFFIKNNFIITRNSFFYIKNKLRLPFFYIKNKLRIRTKNKLRIQIKNANKNN